MASKIEQVVKVFGEKVNYEEQYTSKELVKLLEEAYKEVNKGKGSRAKNVSETKKEPSAYNIFIKNEIEKIKKEGVEGVDPKDYMKIAAARWQEAKTAVATKN